MPAGETELPRAIGTVRGGVALSAVGAALLALAPLFDLVTGPAASPEGTVHVADVDPSVSLVAVTACLAMLVGAMREVLWMHLVGLVLAAGVALVAALLVIVARISDDFASDADLALEPGGLLMIGAFWTALAGIVVALVGVRMVAIAAPPPTLPRRGPEQRARTAGLAGMLGAVAVVTVVTAGLAVAYGVLALGDIRASDERLTGRGMALTGVGLGILMLSLLAAVGGIGSLVASPA